MPISGTITESNSVDWSAISGTLSINSNSAFTVLGVNLAGSQSGHINTAFDGIFGQLTVSANGSYTYSLNNRDTDTQLLSTGETAHDRFVVTYVQGGQTHTLTLDFAIAGVDEPGQQVQSYSSPLEFSADGSVPAGSYLAFTSSTGLQMPYWVQHAVNVDNYGSISVRYEGYPYDYGALFTGYGSTFNNYGRVSMLAVKNTSAVSGAISDGGRNDGVLSAIQTITNVSNSSLARAIGWNTNNATNNGLIEAISTHEAFGVWGQGDFTNNGLIYVEGGQSDDPLGIIGYRSGASVGQHFSNTGTIAVSTTVAGQATVGISFRPNNTNIYQPMWINNSGTIVADTAIEAINGLNVSTTLDNSGHIEGDILFDSGVNIVSNLAGGTIVGNIVLGRETDFFRNAGSITGSINLGDREDVYIGSGSGSVSGTVHGDNGSDVLLGGAAADRLAGDAGNDWIAGGGGADSLSGGTGSDTFAYLLVSDSTVATRDTISDFQSGIDHIDISALGAASFALSVSGSQTILTATNAQGMLSVSIAGTVAAADVINHPASNPLVGTPGDDVLVGPAAGTMIIGDAGNDVLFGGPGNDTLNGGAGNDAMIGGGGNDIYYVDADSDRIIEEAGGGIDEVRTTIDYSLQDNVENATLLGTDPIGVLGNNLANVLTGSDAQNYIAAGGGDDIIYGGGDRDYIDVGGGANTVIYRSTAESTPTAWDYLAGFKHGIDVIDLTALHPLSFSFQEFANSYDVYYGPQMPFPMILNHWTVVWIESTTSPFVPTTYLYLRINGHVDLSDFVWNRAAGEVALALGSAADDILGGTSLSDDIRGRDGNDTLTAGAGNDRLDGGPGNDALDGGSGQDTANYSGQFSDYAITQNSDGTRSVADNRASAPDGIDRLNSIEVLQFVDRAVPLTPSAAEDIDGNIAADALLGSGQLYAAWLRASAYLLAGNDGNGNPASAWSLVATGDFNGDGTVDLLFGQRSGILATWQMAGGAIIGGGNIGNPGAVYALVGKGDFNGDGKTDLLFLNGATGSYASWDMYGTAVVGGATIGNPGPSWTYKAVADFNGDDKSDILFQNVNGTYAIWTLNDTTITGGGNIGNPGSDWFFKGTGDFNGDGKADILFENANGMYATWDMNGTNIIGGGNIGNPGLAFSLSSIGDYNADGYADMLFRKTDGTYASWTMHDTAIVSGAALGNPGSGFAVVTGQAQSSFANLVFQDTATSTVASWQVGSDSVVGGGAFGTPGTQWSAVATGDFAGTGETDVLFRDTSGTLAIWSSNGVSQIGGGNIGNPGADWRWLAAADFNGDGKTDVLFQNILTKAYATWDMSGTSIVGGGTIGTAAGFSFVGAGDLNGDGKADVVFKDASGIYAAWLIDDTAIIGGGNIGNPGGTWSYASLGDLNGDGKADMLFKDASGVYASWDLDGSSIVGGGTIGNPGSSFKLAKMADLNQDGKADLVFVDASGTYASWLIVDTTIIGGSNLGNVGGNLHLI